MTEQAVDVRDLTKRYGPTTAVDGLSLSVTTGSITAVLGPNGAGKTTTVEICEGYRRADAGTVRVLGLDPLRDARALRPRVGVMLQTGGVYPGARAAEMLRHVARLHAHPLAVDPLIERLGLGAAGRTPYRRLSGGQRQRLALALAVVGRPELVFLDEPTAGLDPQARLATWQLITELRRDGVTVVLTTHLLDEAERLADAVVIVDRGRVLASGSPRELSGADAASRLTFAAAPGLDVAALAAALPEGSTVSRLPGPPGRYLVEGDVGPQLLAAVTGWCAAHDVMAEQLSVQRQSLEEVFLELTGREVRE
jgi:ABC-2 type transport system ATP-binding protein